MRVDAEGSRIWLGAMLRDTFTAEEGCLEKEIPSVGMAFEGRATVL